MVLQPSTMCTVHDRTMIEDRSARIDVAVSKFLALLTNWIVGWTREYVWTVCGRESKTVATTVGPTNWTVCSDLKNFNF